MALPTTHVRLTYVTEYGDPLQTLTWDTAFPLTLIDDYLSMPNNSPSNVEFLGWFYDNGEQAQVGDVVNNNTTLTARWRDIESYAKIKESTLTSLADSIRGLNETTSKMTPAQMVDAVSDAVAEIDEQTELLADLLSALEGKAAGGGSSGGGSIDTCTVVINCTVGSFVDVMATILNDDGSAGYFAYGSNSSSHLSTPYTINNVICGSVMTLIASGAMIPTFSCDNGSTHLAGSSSPYAFRVTSTPNCTTTITYTDAG